jgi:hypothetical protein
MGEVPVSYADTVMFQNATQDLFELLERVQSSRLDDQRCVLPPYFTQVGNSPFTFSHLHSYPIQLSRCQVSKRSECFTAASEYYLQFQCCYTATSAALDLDQ